MTRPRPDDLEPVRVLSVVAVAVLAAAVTAAAWTGVWAWTVTGIAVFAVLVAAASYVDRRPRRVILAERLTRFLVLERPEALPDESPMRPCTGGEAETIARMALASSWHGARRVGRTR